MAKTILTGNQELIRDINTQSVIQTITREGSISRAAIASKLKLTKATVSAIVQVLLDRDLVLETGSDDTKKGRKPILLQMNKSCGYIISVNLALDTITLMTANLLGEDCTIYQYHAPSLASDLLPALFQYIHDAAATLPESHYGLLGIALGIHLVTPLSQEFGVPVFMENEANLSVLGEWSYCHHTNEMLYISIHSGIGVGIIMRNQLVKGKNGYAGELGHTIIEPNGRPCPCGNRGCLEQYASERVIFAELSRLRGIPVTPDVFETLYRQGDPDAKRLLEEFILYMSIGINNLLNNFNPDIIVLNSVFIRCCPDLCERITGSLRSNMKQYCHLVPSTLQDTAALLGGICLVQEQFLYPYQI